MTSRKTLTADATMTAALSILTAQYGDRYPGMTVAQIKRIAAAVIEESGVDYVRWAASLLPEPEERSRTPSQGGVRIETETEAWELRSLDRVTQAEAWELRRIELLSAWLDAGADDADVYQVADECGGEVWHAACRMSRRAFTAHARALTGRVSSETVCPSALCGGSGDDLTDPDAPLGPACRLCDGTGVVPVPGSPALGYEDFFAPPALDTAGYHDRPQVLAYDVSMWGAMADRIADEMTAPRERPRLDQAITERKGAGRPIIGG